MTFENVTSIPLFIYIFFNKSVFVVQASEDHWPYVNSFTRLPFS